MAVIPFNLPDLGEGLTEAEIVEWHVSPGDRVVSGQPLVSVETDKAVVEIPSPWSGTVKALNAETGEQIAVGAPLVDLETDQRVDQGQIVGDLEGSKPEVPKTAQSLSVDRSSKPTTGPVRAAPAARALAREKGIDLETVTGSGPDGTITRADVVSLAGTETRAGWEPFSAARKAMARNMAEAGAQVVPATVQDWADVSSWISPEADVLVRLVRAMAKAAEAEPALNAWFDPKAITRRIHETVNLGVAVDTDTGLYVPVLQDVGSQEANQIRTELDRLIAVARAQRLGRQDQLGATVSLSDFGPLGGAFAALVIRPPQVAILGAGRVSEKVVWGENGPEPRQYLPLSLTFDHRAVTGGEAARFLNAVLHDLEHPG
ncbi:dihydrolipoamide acetyltransferase family protein [uncultured Roseibium sp.]|uniref:dihydrolipoamide acetyltransferase family protein n=1 Tax=uncultured Roseibium sp. TaxID=1936171 RepID=UPI0032172DF4